MEIVVKKHDQLRDEDLEYQIKVRKSLATIKGIGNMGDFEGKGYVDIDKKGDRILYTKNLP